jgi:hypothetical protein
MLPLGALLCSFLFEAFHANIAPVISTAYVLGRNWTFIPRLISGRIGWQGTLATIGRGAMICGRQHVGNWLQHAHAVSKRYQDPGPSAVSSAAGADLRRGAARQPGLSSSCSVFVSRAILVASASPLIATPQIPPEAV